MWSAVVAIVSLFLTVWTWWEKDNTQKALEQKAYDAKIKTLDNTDDIVRELVRMRGR